MTFQNDALVMNCAVVVRITKHLMTCVLRDEISVAYGRFRNVQRTQCNDEFRSQMPAFEFVFQIVAKYDRAKSLSEPTTCRRRRSRQSA
jgi:hypothetical protein